MPNFPTEGNRFLTWLGLKRQSSAPATPATGYVAVYFLNSDGLPYYKGADGVVHPFIFKPLHIVGITIDITTGLKGLVQYPYPAGTIIGWSVLADAIGSASIEISKKASSAPPSAPSVPSPTTDKISAAAPIALSSEQTAAVAASGVSTWTTSVVQWDVFQWKLISISGILRATLEIYVQET